MRQTSNRFAAMGAVALLLTNTAWAAGPPSGPLRRCPVDAVVSGAGCMDKYEAGVWRVPDPLGAGRDIVRRIRQGTATAALLAAAGATELGVSPGLDYAPCANSGQNCADDVYAVSLPAVTPSAKLTWFQAQAACENAGKRLPSNAEWQAAVAGSPDPGEDDGTSDCNTASVFHASATGSRTGCVSTRGAFDMVGNLYEWVADWVPQSSACASWGGVDDDQCFAGAATTGEPAALLRGGSFFSRSLAGPLAILGTNSPFGANFVIGFRCVR